MAAHVKALGHAEFAKREEASKALEPATRFEMVLSKRGAKSVGIVFPQLLAGRADRVLELGQEVPCQNC